MEKVLETRRGRLLADRPELHLELVADTSWLGASHGTLASGGPVPPAHVHREHADCFLVLEGGLQLLLTDGEQAVQGEAWVQVPAGVVHTFAPIARVRMLNLHAPSRGFGDYLRGRNPGFDQHDPPLDGGADAASVVVTRLAE